MKRLRPGDTYEHDGKSYTVKERLSIGQFLRCSRSYEFSGCHFMFSVGDTPELIYPAEHLSKSHSPKLGGNKNIRFWLLKAC